MFLFFVTTIGRAQGVEPELTLVPTNAIKLSPFHLINFYPTLEVSYERKIWKRFTFQTEVGYVLNYQTQATDYQNKRGVKLKFEPRYYFHQKGDRVLYYGAVEYYNNIINFDREVHVTECFDVDCVNQFDRLYFYKVKYREQGVSFKGGMTIHFNKVFLDFNAGISIRSIDYDDPLDVDGLDDNFLYFGPNEEDRTVPSPCLGIRVGYRFN